MRRIIGLLFYVGFAGWLLVAATPVRTNNSIRITNLVAIPDPWVVPTHVAWVRETNVIAMPLPNEGRTWEKHIIVSNLTMTTVFVVGGETNTHVAIVKIVPITERVREVRFETRKVYTDQEGP